MSGPLQPGSVFAGYLVEAVLGSGGMGTVYLVRHPRLPRRDALKVLSPQRSADAEFRARFVREADLAARLDHPNVIAVHDRGVSDGLLWIAMQYVDGIDAAGLIRREPGGLAPARVEHILTQAARGLDAAHRAGMLHRDVKPANILIESRADGPERVFVTDFGIARAAGDSTALTEAGVVLATLAYAAPEQLTARPVDQRADVYALGCTLYELLTGAKPYPRANAAAVLHAHLRDAPPRPSAVHRGLPQAIDDVVACALAKDPADRYPSCGELAAAVSAALSGTTIVARTGSSGQSAGQYSTHVQVDGAANASRSPRGRIAMVVSAAVVAVIAVITATVWLGNSGDTAAPAAAATSTTVPVPSTTASDDLATWGTHIAMTTKFPGLLPATPDVLGYQGLSCAAVDEQGRPADLNAPVGEVTEVECRGDRRPVERITVSCRVDSAVVKVYPVDGMVVSGDAAWERVSGRGQIIWGEVATRSGEVFGTLLIGFDDMRSHCRMVVIGGYSGQALYEQWWPGAPI
ncbi:serine/threonine-protein kinase [Nocardia sp. NPDC059180]|uniref:serine/threonine-protein kinase n=1 Tax=Nocardia sp. NPDC059180 TaxID=3346761 RepID=UPI0036CAF0DA